MANRDGRVQSEPGMKAEFSIAADRKVRTELGAAAFLAADSAREDEFGDGPQAGRLELLD